MSKKEERVYGTLSDEKEPKSRAKRIRMLLKKNRRIFGNKQVITDFTEPILMLIRRGRAVEFHEDASKGTFRFKHSDGKEREIYLEPSSQVSFDYGKRKFKGYICHEDYPLPLPENPLVTVETVNMIVEKSMMDTKKLDERKELLKIKTLKVLIWAVVGGVILYILYKAHLFDRLVTMLTGNPPVQPTGTGGAKTVNESMLEITGQIGLVLFSSIKKDFKETWLKIKRF